ncbi:MAG: hypothetical protein JSS61_03090 [Verrucomicrobia bacterium]|nr:hypothetical protein [Verrucomicrobiota bacterium]
MAKKNGSFRHSAFFLLGALLYSFFYWLTGKNYAHVFGILLLILGCRILQKLSNRDEGKIQSMDVTYMCVGAIFDSLSYGFPFGFLPPFQQ